MWIIEWITLLRRANLVHRDSTDYFLEPDMLSNIAEALIIFSSTIYILVYWTYNWSVFAVCLFEYLVAMPLSILLFFSQQIHCSSISINSTHKGQEFIRILENPHYAHRKFNQLTHALYSLGLWVLLAFISLLNYQLIYPSEFVWDREPDQM